eukprot:gene289-377_t
MTYMIWLQTAIVLSAIIIGTRLKGIGLGLMGGLGLALLIFVFKLKPADPPFDLLLIIMAVVTAAGALEASGGLNYLSSLAEKAIRKYPHRITFIAPFVTYLFTFLAGTGHIIYSILPIIATVARQTGVRPERPLSASVIAAQQAAIASPISAPTAILLGLLAPHGIELTDVLCILLPATLGAVLIMALCVNKLGKELKDEPSYVAWMKENTETDTTTVTTITFSKEAKRSVLFFIFGIATIILLGAYKGIRPHWQVGEKIVYLDMSTIIVTIMLGVSALMTMTCHINPANITKAGVFTSGIQAVISILGVSWLGSTFVNANQDQIMQLVQAQIAAHPWQFGIILFFMSILLFSQTATFRALIPLGLALGIPAISLLAASAAVNGLFFVPNYPTILAAINLDRTGTTKFYATWLDSNFYSSSDCICHCQVFMLGWVAINANKTLDSEPKPSLLQEKARRIFFPTSVRGITALVYAS